MKFEDVKVGDVFQLFNGSRIVVVCKNKIFASCVRNDGEADMRPGHMFNNLEPISRNQRVVVSVENDEVLTKPLYEMSLDELNKFYWCDYKPLSETLPTGTKPKSLWQKLCDFIGGVK